VAGFYESEIREGFKIKNFKKSTKLSFKKYPLVKYLNIHEL
jgi:hypothetical protein